jgi:hypothetical protein
MANSLGVRCPSALCGRSLIYDYVDREVPLLARMFEKRMRGYRAIGYRSAPAPVASATPLNQTTVDYDERLVSDFDAAT